MGSNRSMSRENKKKQLRSQMDSPPFFAGG